MSTEKTVHTGPGFEANCTHQELEDALARIRSRQDDVTRAEMALEEEYRRTADLAGKTFLHNDTWSQIRERENKKKGRKVPFVVTLPSRPSEYLGNRKKPQETAQEPEHNTNQTTSGVEVGQAHNHLGETEVTVVHDDTQQDTYAETVVVD